MSDRQPGPVLEAEAVLFAERRGVEIRETLGAGVGQIGAGVQKALTDIAMIEQLGADAGPYRAQLANQVDGVARTLDILASMLAAGQPIDDLDL